VVVTIAVPLCAIPLRGPIALRSLVWGHERLLQDVNLTRILRAETASNQPAMSLHSQSEPMLLDQAENPPLEMTRSEAVARAQ
jgi:hypothetical protein